LGGPQLADAAFTVFREQPTNRRRAVINSHVDAVMLSAATRRDGAPLVAGSGVVSRCARRSEPQPGGDMTRITKITNAVGRRVPSAPVLIGGVYCLCVLAIIAISAGSILVTDEDPFRSDGPVAEIVSIGVAGTAALVVGVLAGRALVRSPGRARVGAVVFGALAIIALPLFWSGAPGIFGAVAAWLAGLTRGRRPLNGGSRVFGVIGLCVAILNLIVSLGGELLHLLIVFVS
jgi:hypothetical protein